jgi:hypothetical protein
MERHMIKIIIESDAIRTINYTSKKGQPAQLRAQEGRAYLVQPDGKVGEFPDKFEFLLGREQAPYTRGTYTLDPRAISIDGDKKLRVAPLLVPVGGPK